MPLGFAQVSAPELDDDETSINRQVVRLMGLTEDTEDNHWLSIHALRMRYSDASIIQPMAMRLWAKGEVLLLVLHIYGFGSNWDLDLPIWLQPKSIWTDLDPFGLAQKPNVFGNQFVQIRACPKFQACSQLPTSAGV